MREIKFRAWDDMINDFADWETLRQYPFEDIERTYDKIDQYTGLKDKNGKEIFEGDIVRTGIYMVSAEPAYYEDLEVVYFRDAFCIKRNEHSYNNIGDSEKVVKTKYIPNVGERATEYESTIEVIGNIYENPELLNLTPITPNIKE